MSQKAEAQKKNDFGNPALTHYLNEQHTRYISFSGYAELWARYAQLNPGSMINNDAKSDISDLSLRRIRVKMTYKPTEKLMFVLQGGTTNVNMNAKGSNYFDLLDAYAEYAFNDKITVGAGRSTWRGLSRFTTGPLNTLLYDLPAYATSNAGATDYTVRERQRTVGKIRLPSDCGGSVHDGDCRSETECIYLQ
ncbi:porin [uncultured Chryseobacterium sp.]|uniref:porin n=1 Tax=uncultured Chryseobacterium sp. TaxID=259322 RepID=UPI0025ED29EE|nr:porin [uncultured Chryseobacterium sp.]